MAALLRDNGGIVDTGHHKSLHPGRVGDSGTIDRGSLRIALFDPRGLWYYFCRFHQDLVGPGGIDLRGNNL